MFLLPASLRRLASKALNLADKEVSAIKTLHEESKATVRRMSEADPGLADLLAKAHAYAVFPAVGKATAVVGGAFGKGEVFQGDSLIGYAGLIQVTLGVQVGGQTFSEIVLFLDAAALNRFKAGRTAFAANASAVLVKAGAAASARYESGVAVFVAPEGGMMLEAAIGAQKFFFKPSAIGRTKTAPKPRKASPARGKQRPAAKAKRATTKPGAAKSQKKRPTAQRRPAARSARS